MSLGFFTADHSRLHQPSHIGVVARYLRNPLVADQVEPRVANVDVVERVIFRVIDRTPDDRRRGAGRSHAPQFGMREAVSPDLLVGRLQSLDQGGLRVVSDSVTIDRHQRFHCQPARFLTALVATHAIRYDRQPPLAQELPVVLRLPIAKEIFVILPLAPDIRLARHLNPGANLHPGTISIRGMTSIVTIAFTGKLPIIRVAGRTLKQKVAENCDDRSEPAESHGFHFCNLASEFYNHSSTITSCPINQSLRRRPHPHPSRPPSFISATNSEPPSAIFRPPALS